MVLQPLFEKAKVVPILSLGQTKEVVGLGQALMEGGCNLLEITLRTPNAVEAIRQLRAALPTCIIGAGTITEAEQLYHVHQAGAHFAVSPGIHPLLIETAKQLQIPYMPGIATPSDILIARQYGLNFLKFFPATLFGGKEALGYFHALFPALQFCPTGGINEHNLLDYLSLPNVPCVGGTWFIPSDLLASHDYSAIRQLTQRVLSFAHSQTS